jgi:hypothetical protein
MDFEPPPPPILSGNESFDGLDARVADFWKFAMSDLRTNNVRGYLAEFLVARALGAEGARVEWDPWDVTAPNGTKVEVKSSGYLQSWAQRKLSEPTYRVAPAYGWDGATGSASTEQTFNADVYVFCLHTAMSHDEYDPLRVSQWRFYVASRSLIELQAGSRMSLATLERVCGEPVSYSGLSAAVATAAADTMDES